MKIQSINFSAACAITFAVLWVVCTALVWMSPSSMAVITSHMLHLDGAHLEFTLTFAGASIGLVIWSLLAAITGLFIAVFYNLMLQRETRE